jgi:hypothetical protein
MSLLRFDGDGVSRDCLDLDNALTSSEALLLVLEGLAERVGGDWPVVRLAVDWPLVRLERRLGSLLAADLLGDLPRLVWSVFSVAMDREARLDGVLERGTADSLSELLERWDDFMVDDEPCTVWDTSTVLRLLIFFLELSVPTLLAAPFLLVDDSMILESDLDGLDDRDLEGLAVRDGLPDFWSLPEVVVNSVERCSVVASKSSDQRILEGLLALDTGMDVVDARR